MPYSPSINGFIAGDVLKDAPDNFRKDGRNHAGYTVLKADKIDVARAAGYSVVGKFAKVTRHCGASALGCRPPDRQQNLQPSRARRIARCPAEISLTTLIGKRRRMIAALAGRSAHGLRGLGALSFGIADKRQVLGPGDRRGKFSGPIPWARSRNHFRREVIDPDAGWLPVRGSVRNRPGALLGLGKTARRCGWEQTGRR